MNELQVNSGSKSRGLKSPIQRSYHRRDNNCWRNGPPQPVHSRFPLARNRWFFFISLLCATSRQKPVAKTYNAQIVTNQHTALIRIAVSRSGRETISLFSEEAIGSKRIVTRMPGANRLDRTRTPSRSEAETAANNRRALRVVVWFPFDTCLPDSRCALSSALSTMRCRTARCSSKVSAERRKPFSQIRDRRLALAGSITRRTGMNRVSICIRP
jgi:hypothetical protein